MNQRWRGQARHRAPAAPCQCTAVRSAAALMLLSAQRVVSELYSAVWRGLTASEYNCTGVGMVVDYIIIEISSKRLHRLFQPAKYFFFRIADVFSQYSFSLHFY